MFVVSILCWTLYRAYSCDYNDDKSDKMIF